MENKKQTGKKKKLTAKAKKNRRIIIGFCSGFMALVITFGAVLVTTLTLRDKNALVKYNGVTMEKGVVSYFIANAKGEFMEEYGIEVDLNSAWYEKSESGETYEELLVKETELYVKSIAIGAYLFDRYSSLDSSDEDAIRDYAENKLSMLAGGNEETFNQLTAEMGFTYDDFLDGLELEYKASCAMSVIYGENGAVLESGEYNSECDKFFETYSHVKLLYISTPRYIVKEEDGSLKVNMDGKFVTDVLNDVDFTARMNDIEEIERLIEGYENDLDEQMSPEYFELMQKKYNFDTSNIDMGYYFAEGSQYREHFASDTADGFADTIAEGLEEQLEEVVDTALGMEIGEYRCVEGSFGVCFIYKYENTPYAYALGSSSAFFHDFFSDASYYLYRQMLTELESEVEIREGYYGIDLVAIPYNDLF